MSLFGRKRKQMSEREVPDPDWASVGSALADGEQQVDTCKGWKIALQEGEIDQPCGVYLTDRAIHVRTQPDTLAQPETTSVPFSMIAKCDLGTSDQGSPRLVVMYDPVGEKNPDDLSGFGVDLRPHEQGIHFGERVASTVDKR